MKIILLALEKTLIALALLFLGIGFALDRASLHVERSLIKRELRRG